VVDGERLTLNERESERDKVSVTEEEDDRVT
jgi:hypothetical protein